MQRPGEEIGLLLWSVRALAGAGGGAPVCQVPRRMLCCWGLPVSAGAFLYLPWIFLLVILKLP